MYSARMLECPKSTKNKKITPNAYFQKIQSMFIYISYELFWDQPSNHKKNQVKLGKMDIFVEKNQ